MISTTTRRTFLAESSRVGGALALAAVLGRSLSANQGPPAWPVTCRDAILQPTGQKDSWSALQAVGADGVEIHVADDLSLPELFHPTQKYTLANPAGIKQFAADALTANQRITAFCMYNRFEERTGFEIQWCEQVARLAQSMGIPTIRIDVVPIKLARPAFLKLAIEALGRIMEATEVTGVTFAIENHGNTSNDPGFLYKLFAGVGSQRLGLTLDTANFYWFGHPLSKVYELYETFASRVFHTHCKSIHYPVEERERERPMGWKYAECHGPLTEGDIDFTRVVSILRRAGYHNDLCVEDEFVHRLPAAQATKALAGDIALLKRLAGSR